MIRLLILADDFTGGLDTGVQFASRGISTCVITNPKADYAAEAGECEVLVVVAETRHLAPEAAYDAVYAAVGKGAALGIPYIYKKTDSALRGNIGAELTAAMKACGAESLPFIPALPGMKRVTRGGIHYVDGVPVAESVFGRDPFEPVRESEVARLIALQSGVTVTNPARKDLAGAEGIAVIDAETEEDLHEAGKALAESGRLRITAGCAGFAAVLPELLGLTRSGRPEIPQLDEGLFVLCGSVNPITQRQLDDGERNGFTRIHIRPEEKLEPDLYRTEKGKQILKGWQEAENDHPWMILDANDPEPDNRETAEAARKKGFSIEEVRQRISGSLGLILSGMLEGKAERTLLITGGDTLLEGMKCLKIYRMIPLTEVFPGVVLSRVNLAGRERFVMTKSGGFGQETLLKDLRSLMSKE